MGYTVVGATSSADAVITARWCFALVMAATAAWCDMRTWRIPNWITGPMLLCGLCVSATVGGWGGLGDGALAALVLGLPFFVLFAIAGGGAGDSKAMAALGSWVGLSSGLVILAAVAISGGVLAIGYAIWKKRLRGVLGNLRSAGYGAALVVMQGERVEKAREFLPPREAMLKMPYGLAIFVGTASAAGWVLLWH